MNRDDSESAVLVCDVALDSICRSFGSSAVAIESGSSAEPSPAAFRMASSRSRADLLFFCQSLSRSLSAR